MPPFWWAGYGAVGIDQGAYNDWEQSLQIVPLKRAGDSPLRQSLPALIAAWEGGLDTVIIVPYARYFARRTTTRHLLVSRSAHDNPAEFTRALGTRPERGGRKGLA